MEMPFTPDQKAFVRDAIALLIPSDVHHGRAEQRRAARRAVFMQAHDRRPDRFVRRRPEPPALAPTTYINRSELLKAA